MEEFTSLLDMLSPDMADGLLKQMNPVDIIELSNVSPQWEHVVKSNQTEIKEVHVNLEGMEYRRYWREKTCAILGIKPVQRSFVHFLFYYRKEEELKKMLEDPEDPTFVEKVFDDETFVCQVRQTNIQVFTPNPKLALFNVIDHMLRLFTGTIHMVNIADCLPVYDDIIIPILKKKQVNMCKKIMFPFSVEPVSNALASRVMAIPNLHAMECLFKFPDDFRSNKKITIPHVRIGSSAWMTRHYFLNMDCENIVLTDSNFDGKDMNAFVKNWLEGDNKKLRRMQLTWCNPVDWKSKFQNHIMDGIKGNKWKPKDKTRSRYFKIRKGQIDCSSGIDITRSDGAFATIMRDNYSFSFVVWNYPETTTSSSS
ncbi:hypothetical protein L3Y34_014866 [Caenorhabditis briggsae]|uniref:Sdz-33 F-box domain-containing protein n=1 Tax=Caenorhabditis briggsae TaxID=6238 RepID=A0AAE9IYP7_CAEBR|nr:hypothetical protein L3Y34_014866 [Caenorhabditis briggsae]